MKDSVRTYVVCPKCKGANLKLIEVSEEYLTYQQDENGKILNSDEGKPEHGDIIGVRAVCLNAECGHRWTVRRVCEIVDLPNWPQEGEEEDSAPAVPDDTTEEPQATEPGKIEQVITEEVAAQKQQGKQGKKGKKAAAPLTE